MRSNDSFDYNLIKTLILVFETKSMGGAAKALGVSAPTLSYSLNKIRKYYNDPLFIKTAHGIKATPVANQLYPLFKKVDDDFKRVVTLGDGEMSSIKNVIIRTNSLVEFFLMDELLKDDSTFGCFNFDFNNKILTDEQRISSIIARAVDIDIGPAIRSDNSLVSTPLFKSKLVVLCSIRHPRMGDVITQGQWLEEEHAIVSIMKGVSYWPVIFNELLVQRKIRYSTASFLNVFHCLEMSEMIMVIPECLTRNITSKFALRSVAMPWLDEDLLHFYAYIHSRAKDDEKLQTIIDLLRME